MPLGSVQTNSSEKAAADRGSRRIWPQVQAWRQPSAPIRAFKTRDASRVITVTQSWIATGVQPGWLFRDVSQIFTLECNRRLSGPPSSISILHIIMIFGAIAASTAGRGVTCMGHMPSYWANPQNFSQWPSGYKPIDPQATLFGPPQGVFANSPYSGDPTLLDVLNGAATPHNHTTDKTAMYVAAALLNAAAGLTPVLLVPAVRDIWSEYGASGYGLGGSFSPSSGAHWTPLEINEYLLTTMA
jgi:hypothetical protein